MKPLLVPFSVFLLLLAHSTLADESEDESDETANEIAADGQHVQKHAILIGSQVRARGEQANVQRRLQNVCGQSTATGRIVGGSSAAVGEVPWQAMLLRNGHYVCGGTLISPQVVLTAAHCVEERRGESARWSVFLGKQRRLARDTGQQQVEVAIVRRHPNSLVDLALVHLVAPAEINGLVNVACLPEMTTSLSPACFVSGWGRTSEGGSLADTLQKVQVRTFSLSECLRVMPDFSAHLHEGNICAGQVSTGQRDSCQGDSGGPLSCFHSDRWFVVGIVSWGRGCGRADSLGVYENVLAHLPWILESSY